jgi:hypothetical protein
MFETPYLASDTICSGRPLKHFMVGDNVVLIQRIVEKGIPQFVAIKGIVTGPSKYHRTNIYSYIVDKTDNELAGLYIPFISNGNIIQNTNHDYSSKEIMIDMIRPYSPIHNKVTLNTIGVLRPEKFISLTLSFEINKTVTHTLLITNDGFMVVIN